MPNIKSAKKRVKVIKVKTLRNQMFLSQMRTMIKKYEAALQAGDKVHTNYLRCDLVLLQYGGKGREKPDFLCTFRTG